MRQLVLRLAAGFSACFIIACGIYPGEQRAAWRDEAEAACLRSNAVQPSAKIVPAEPIGAYGCGMSHPFKVAELPQSKVALSKPTTMACSMIPALDHWVKDVVQPAAVRQFGTYVTEVQTVGAYSCRRINGGYNMSEHAYGNAMDVSGFKLADGRRIRIGKELADLPPFQVSADAVKKFNRAAYTENWSYDLDAIGDGPVDVTYGVPVEEALAEPFIESIRISACAVFSTVLGPGQADHEDHLHLDLAHRKNGKGVCK